MWILTRHPRAPMWEGTIHNQLPLNMQSITHPLAQGQLNNNRTKSIIRVSLKNNARSPLKTQTIL
jgi:hypothetical protein